MCFKLLVGLLGLLFPQLEWTICGWIGGWMGDRVCVCIYVSHGFSQPLTDVRLFTGACCIQALCVQLCRCVCA